MRIKAAISSSFAAHGVQMAVSIATVRFFLLAFGTELYGYWGALLGLTSYLSLLNLGVAQTVSSRVSTANPDTDPGAIPRAVQMGLRVYARTCLWALPPIALTAWLLPWAKLFHLAPSLDTSARLAALAVATTFVFELPFSIFRAALSGLGEISTERAITSSALLIRLAASWLFIHLHPPLWLAVVILSAINILGHLGCLFALRRRVPGLFRRPEAAETDAADALRFRAAGLHFLLLQIAGAIVWSTDALLVGVLIDSTQAARVSVAWRALSIVLTLGNLVGPALGPALAQAWARGDKERAASLGLESAQLLGGVVFAGLWGMLVTGQVIFDVWLGKGMFLDTWTWVIYCVIIAVQSILVIPHSFMVQAGKHEQYARWTGIEAALKLGLTVLLVKLIGLPGLPLATLIARAATTLWFLPMAYARALDTDLGAFLRGVLRPLGWASFAFAALFGAGRLALPTQGPMTTLAIGTASGVAFVIVFFTRGITPELRRRLLALLPIARRASS